MFMTLKMWFLNNIIILVVLINNTVSLFVIYTIQIWIYNYRIKGVLILIKNPHT